MKLFLIKRIFLKTFVLSAVGFSACKATLRKSARHNFFSAGTPEVAPRACSCRRELSGTQSFTNAAEATYGLRERGLSECRRVLESPHRYIHDSWKCLHAPLRILRGAERCSLDSRLRRAAPCRGSVRPIRASLCGCHQRESRRSQGR